jgi:hypothetical protein
MGYDPVTDADGRIFFLTKSVDGTKRLREKLNALEVVNEPPAFES